MPKKFYARIRPHLDLEALRSSLDCLPSDDRTIPSDLKKLFFTSGRAALAWLLSCLRDLRQSPLRVGVQAFTCPVVLQAILASGNIPVFLDIDPNYLTTTWPYLEGKNFEVLILTHLFGLPNPDYFQICHLCKLKNIVVIDDLAQTIGASINKQEIGLASDFSIYSFGFDKPISCYRGGLLHVNNYNYLDYLQRQYQYLAQESRDEEIRDLYRLIFYYYLFNPDSFKEGDFFHSYLDNWFLWIIKKYNLSLDKFNKYRKYFPYNLLSLANSVYYKLSGQKSKIDYYRLGFTKINYLVKLMQSYDSVKQRRNQTAVQAQRVLARKFPGIRFPHLEKHIKPAWLRLPALASPKLKSDIIFWGRQVGIEIGCFNWSGLIFYEYKRAYYYSQEQLPNSYKIISEIINIPLWDQAIWEV